MLNSGVHICGVHGNDRVGLVVDTKTVPMSYYYTCIVPIERSTPMPIDACALTHAIVEDADISVDISDAGDSDVEVVGAVDSSSRADAALADLEDADAEFLRNLMSDDDFDIIQNILDINDSG